MEKYSIGLLLIGLLLFVVGCSTTSTTGGTAFIGGTQGLKTDFMPGNPPDAIFDGGQSQFSIVLRLENVGESLVDTGAGYVQINGLDPGTYGTSSFKQDISTAIEPAKKNFDGSTLNGGIITVEFGPLQYGPVITGNLQQTVWADICYKYTSTATAQLCIKKDPQLLLSDKKICEVEGEKSPQNSGAPIQVTSLKENFAGNGKIGLTYTITHVGSGDNFFDDRATVCNDVESNNQRGVVHVVIKPVTLGGSTVTPVCSGLSEGNGNEGYLRLFKDNSGKEEYPLYCTLDASSTDSIFQVPIDATFTYMYLQHVEKSITIRHIAQ